MIALLQRVTRASVHVDGRRVAAIRAGVLALIAAERDDDEARAVRLAERMLAWRLFADDAQRMNHSVREAGAGVLAVPQFTLAADTRRGNRPGFSRAASGEHAEALFEHCVETLRGAHDPVEAGIFGADMRVALINDGPVTFWLEA